MVGSEDCLYLNVWAPCGAAIAAKGRRLPVMMWIHGGGNSMGSADHYTVANRLAGNQHVVVVTINYRLGVLGWFHHPALQCADSSAEDRSGNYALLDLIEGLRWIRDNIHAFGGDRDNVTIFGESAGGFNVLSLMCSPLARGLFHRAIAQSGGIGRARLVYAENYVDDADPGSSVSSREIVNRLLVAAGRGVDRAEAKALQNRMPLQEIAAFLRSRSPQALLEPFAGTAMGMYRLPTQLRDGTVLPDIPAIEQLSDASRYNCVPVIVGTNRDEAKLFLAADPRLTTMLDGKIPQVKDWNHYHRQTRYFSDQWKLLGADDPARAMRRAQGPSVYAYRFDWDEQPRLPMMDMAAHFGACHGLEIGFVFGDEGREMASLRGAFTNENLAGRRELAHAMSSYWSRFAYSGDPGRGIAGELPEWTAWDDRSPDGPKFLVFDTRADGGIRMSSDEITAAALKQRLFDDRHLFESVDALRALYKEMFFPEMFHADHHWDEEEYLSLGSQA